jgi:hypothetical protein
MVRTSQCFRTEFFQPDGPLTLAAAELVPYTRKPASSFLARDLAASSLKFSCDQKWRSSVSTSPFACMKASRITRAPCGPSFFDGKVSVDFSSCLSKRRVRPHPREEVGGAVDDRQLIRESVIQEAWHGGPRNRIG